MATRDRARSFDDDYDYSDDFISDEDPDGQSMRRTPKSSYAGSGKQRAPMRKKAGAVRSGPSNSRGKKGKPPPGRSMDPVASRVLSASRHRMNELRNQVEELKIQLTDMKEENRILKKMQHRQERALEKFEGQESDLPQLIAKHQNELRTVREQLRRMREKYDKTDRYLRDAEDELERTKAKLKKFRELAQEKELPERQELSRKLNKAMIDMEEKDRRVKELERYVENLKKNHRHELGVEMARHRDCKRELDEVNEKFRKTENTLKEKEKELEIKFIYSNRGRPASKLPASYGGTPHSGTPPPPRQRRAPSLQDLSPRDKARAYETRRREEMRAKNHSMPPKPKRGAKRAEPLTNSFDHPSETDQSLLRDSLSDSRHIQEWEQEERSRQQEEERQLQQQDRSGLDQQLADMKRREAQLRAEEEKAWKEAEAERNKAREERALQERLERERVERERREKEEHARREKERQEQQERRAREERERLANDAKALEEKKKKDLLLARLKQMDEGQNDPFAMPTSGSKPPAATASSSAKGSFFLTGGDDARSQKSAGLSSSKANSAAQGRSKGPQSGGDTLDLGGYQPSFTSHLGGGGRNRGGAASNSLFSDSKDSSSTTASTDRKSKLMADLFGKPSNAPSQPSQQENGDELFTLSDSPKKTANSSRPSKFPWEESKSSGKTSSTTAQRQNSSTIFGGGSALLDDEPVPSDPSKMLPKRQRQTSSTFQSKPAVTAVDHYDDDIEEVIL